MARFRGGGNPAARTVTHGDVIVVRSHTRHRELEAASADGNRDGERAEKAVPESAYIPSPPVPEYEFGTWRLIARHG